ncbi:sulfurtransferase [Lentisalinibacter orientalis]|uniref:sulfurtransferase n=1 Tax=Lentisalinibacter orientalis TaxID=2992241 RepID=UPI00386DFC85
MSETPLIDPAELSALAANDRLCIVDCRFVLSEPDAGRRAYGEGHLPGAVYAHLDDDLAGPVTPLSGRHPLPDPDHFAALLGAWGIRPDTLVVAYDDASGALASRLWWMLGWVGHERRRVLDGGIDAWLAAGLALTVAEPSPPGAPAYPVRPDPERVAGTAAVLEALAAGVPVLDARARDRFLGRQEPIDPVAGHIPGSLNHPFSANLADDGRFLPPAELAARLARLGVGEDGRAVSLCGSGVTACHTILAAAVAGLPEPRLYPGSWSEWIRDPERPVASGRD